MTALDHERQPTPAEAPQPDSGVDARSSRMARWIGGFMMRAVKGRKEIDKYAGKRLDEIEPEPWGDWMEGRLVVLSPLSQDDHLLHVLKTDAQEQAFNDYFDEHDVEVRAAAKRRLDAKRKDSDS